MKKINIIILSITLVVLGILPVFSQEKESDAFKNWTPPKDYIIDTRIDNMGYWMRLAELGLVPVAPENPYLYTKFTGYGPTDDGTDIPVTTNTATTQSENSIFVNPSNNTSVLNSNNSTPYPVSSILGADYWMSTNTGANWSGSINGAGGVNRGDPATAISKTGRYYIGFINQANGQSVSWSTNAGTSWSAVVAGTSNNLCDKNHLWIDNSNSAYTGNLYVAWTQFGTPNSYKVEIVRSTNGGLNWSAAQNISNGTASYLDQGVNITTGPNGEVYVFWCIYDTWPSGETAYGFTKSTNGGANYSTATRIISNTLGIRGYIKTIRCNSFPSAACDISGGTYNGTIYMVWANRGFPGVNTGSDVDVYLIKSTNQGTNWSTPIYVTNDCPVGNGKVAWFPWITCDPVTGNLSVVFYDDRNCSSSMAETWVANSSNGGATWNNFKVSDVAFTPSTIPGLSGNYMGDYLGISARGGLVYPCWMDNRGNNYRTYVSPYTFGPAAQVSIAITSGSNPTCAGVSVTFTATPVNGGTAPTYQWQVNTINVGTGPTYTSTTLANGDIVTCVMTSNLAGVLGSPATSCPITMVVNPTVTPSVSIAITSGSNPSCVGASVTFTATPTNGGTAPTYQWKVNGGNVGTGSTYTSTTLATGDIVTCVMTSNASCITTPTATSNAITMTVNPVPPTPTITQNGHQLTSSSAVGNQWYLNGSIIPGANNQIYNVTQNGSYTVVVTINNCSSLPSAPVVIIDVAINEYKNQFGLSIFPNPNDGNFTVTFNTAVKSTFKIEITDVIGKLVYSENINDFSGVYANKINLIKFGKGIYTIKLTNFKNETYKKIIVY